MTCRYVHNRLSCETAEPHGAPPPWADRAADQRKVQNQEGPA